MHVVVLLEPTLPAEAEEFQLVEHLLHVGFLEPNLVLGSIELHVKLCPVLRGSGAGVDDNQRVVLRRDPICTLGVRK